MSETRNENLHRNNAAEWIIVLIVVAVRRIRALFRWK